MNAVYFSSPAKLRAWFAKNHANELELWVGFFKKATGQSSVTWPESVDEALCVGWIDGVRKTVDADRYRIRFTPRKPTSIWSAVNIRRVQVLTTEGRMKPAGLKSFAARRENKSGIYAYEQRTAELPVNYERLLKKNVNARQFFHSLPPGYRKTIVWWVVSAKKRKRG